MRTSDFDYLLPPDRIAQTPVEPRDSSRLMVLRRDDGGIEHRVFRDIIDYLRPGDLLVCNESRVIPARLHGRRVETGGRIEVLLISPRADNVWEALVKPGRRLRPGARIEFAAPNGTAPGAGRATLAAEVIERTETGGRLIAFDRAADLSEVLDALGTVPLPPYVHVRLGDAERYQTIYARVRGSVAAPTAGLHFTPELIEKLRAQDVELAFVTLHIGLDTFRPVQEENIVEHRVHSELCELSPEVAARLNQARAEGRRIVAVGTTSVRVLESAAREVAHETDSSFREGRVGLASHVVGPFCGWTDIFIYPGYRFKAVDALITNFHLPRSTLLMLVSAFAGKETIDDAYAEAIREGYRFYSFGDCMLIA
ncbi:MAG: tRNA preQ1(34) S-adenosylmethionine ribosyltransferase-isomerase QueA [Chloroflexi bacterium]|nr:tRNA preQ1(34) S-adenosylmethionine ribosyltransferase-isomerase QueA [Chloroflexota bacterium]